MSFQIPPIGLSQFVAHIFPLLWCCTTDAQSVVIVGGWSWLPAFLCAIADAVCSANAAVCGRSSGIAKVTALSMSPLLFICTAAAAAR